ncbi:hypothetical protein AMECASPLE_039024 [Ameca splendens]|uniref:Uncharacterized protein n=1 Tax=Ameca splendens TaxID=208324 RepID=A0ABV0XXJ5_9TELE
MQQRSSGLGLKPVLAMLRTEAFVYGSCTLLPPKSSFQVFCLEKEKAGPESMLLVVQSEVSTVIDDLGCHVICWCWSTEFSEVCSQCSNLPVSSSAFHASFC